MATDMNVPDIDSQDRAPKTAVRVQRFRDRLRADECGRLDVWIGNGWIRLLTLISEHDKRPMWAIVQDAVKAYAAQRARIMTPPKDRVTGNTRRVP